MATPPALSEDAKAAIAIVHDTSKPLADREAAIERIAKSDGAVYPLAALHHDADPAIQRAAAEAAERIGADRILVADLSSANLHDRQRAALLLGYLRARTAEQPLVGALADESPQVREEAAGALGALGSPSAVPALATTLQGDPTAEVRMAAAQSLGTIGGEPARAALKEAQAKETDDFVKLAIEKSLAGA